ncbi:MAG: hypothetical protein A2494_01305 [Candidatus Lloydbacteria bacterium RIFOXYC12_FULL_46_25]|uniref:HTH marR-type domain-containing protein n=1 Tax=Candidatus Lloydbacteria bacterium RIFOXYC12_FULL_46_25 TaxID=1798670 RepID=A0A1G2E2K1_9BACT|nr:MAG: hypothetical protein A2494_01305 [Candidatus Lloydbacteria bacterium RIFOXYC12_FULL_46_25]
MERKKATDQLIVSIHKETRAATLFVHTISEITKIHSTDIRCLEFLSEVHLATAGDLARATGLTTGAVTAMIDRLENAGFIKRERDKNDRRKTIVKLLGIPSKLKEVREMFSKQIPNILSGYTTEELQLIANWNMKMATIFHGKIKKLNDLK